MSREVPVVYGHRLTDRGLQVNGFCYPTRPVPMDWLPNPTRTRGYGSGRVNKRVWVFPQTSTDWPTEWLTFPLLSFSVTPPIFSHFDWSRSSLWQNCLLLTYCHGMLYRFWFLLKQTVIPQLFQLGRRRQKWILENCSYSVASNSITVSGIASSVPPLLTQLLLCWRGPSSGSAPSQSAVQVFGTRFPHTSETFILLRLFATLLKPICFCNYRHCNVLSVGLHWCR